jgi:hypothetical protein
MNERTQPAAESCPRCSGKGKVGTDVCPCTARKLDKRAPRNPLNEQQTGTLDAMLRLNAEMGLRICGSLRDWRLVERKRGTLRGLVERCNILCTDGVAAFVLRDDGTTLFCHLANFEPDKKEKAKPKSKRQELLDLI